MESGKWQNQIWFFQTSALNPRKQWLTMHAMNELESCLESIAKLATQLIGLNENAVVVYEPIVGEILENACTDARHIESTLDQLLGFAGSEEGLQLFKRLCRYYWTIAPEATAFYVHAYRDMWDSDDPSTEVETGAS